MGPTDSKLRTVPGSRARVRATHVADARPSSLVMLSAAAAAACLVLVLGWQVGAQDDSEPAWTADIRNGTCDAPGDTTALLEGLATSAAAGEGPQVATSITDVMQPFTDLMAEPQVIVAGRDGAAGLVCGALDGGLATDQGLTVALADADGAVRGVAWLGELGLEATTVHVFVVEDGLDTLDDPPTPDGSALPGPSESPSAAPSPSASPQSDGAVLPDEEIDPGEDIDVDVDG